MNKIKHRMKGLYARGKSLNTRYTYNFTSYGQNNTFSSVKSYINSAGPAQINHELEKYLEIDPNLKQYRDCIKKLIPMKFKEVLRDALGEYQR